MKKTPAAKQDQIKRNWHLIDLKDQTLGRVATNIAQKLIGKNKPYYTPNIDCGDYVVVTNAKDISLSGKKKDQKIYRHHSGYPGGFKEIPLSRQMEKDPTIVIKKAVSGMLPKNKLRSNRLKRLKIFINDKHPYQDKLKKMEK